MFVLRAPKIGSSHSKINGLLNNNNNNFLSTTQLKKGNPGQSAQHQMNELFSIMVSKFAQEKSWSPNSSTFRCTHSTPLLFTHSSSSLMMSMITNRSLIARNYLSLSLSPSCRHSISAQVSSVVRSCKIPSSSSLLIPHSLTQQMTRYYTTSEVKLKIIIIRRLCGTVCNRIESLTFKLSACVTRVQFMWQSLARWMADWLSGHCD